MKRSSEGGQTAGCAVIFIVGLPCLAMGIALLLKGNPLGVLPIGIFVLTIWVAHKIDNRV
jgi:hypothetical protein